jgi:hypothetical protein
MWVFLTRRLRMWVLISLALPVARFLVHRLAVAAGQRDPRATSSRMLQSADSAMASVSQRAKQRRAR